jgi:hypothetical protein
MNPLWKPILFGSSLILILSLLFWNTRTEGHKQHLDLVDRIHDEISRIDAKLNVAV